MNEKLPKCSASNFLATAIPTLRLKSKYQVFHFAASLHLPPEQTRNGQAQLSLTKMQSADHPFHQGFCQSGNHESLNDCASPSFMYFLHALCSGMPGLVHNCAGAF
jgi:hypothetical protein